MSMRNSKFKNDPTEFVAHRRGKDGKIQKLRDHLEEVSKITGEFASQIELRKQGELIGLLHDIGKASQEFQQYIKSAFSRPPCGGVD